MKYYAETTSVYQAMLDIARGPRARACKVAAAIHPDDVIKANALASNMGGWDIVATRFPELLAGAKHESPSPKMAATTCPACEGDQ